ncbi:MAG: site-specific DNA-methyltransferase [Candidatus Binatus sp.]|uniref:DNA-methyltransferase n=1 Tax=Candidatus Binatus sp. TaxID=2811406 RepID=UPI00272486D4|nr:site-specific DNA-methyltransferase [Candidatus Binatus sp.]MDO8433084.1 site-specific DNA-methyltransferase [Candidatus Binatus sp.]
MPAPGVIYSGDCVEVMRDWPDGIFDACITDPPYNMSRRKGLKWAFSSHVTMSELWDRFSNDDYFDFTRRWLAEVIRVVRPNGNILVFGSFHNIYVIGFILEHVLGRRILQQITWFKPNAQPNITGRLPTESTEYIIWACNNTPEHAAKWTFDYAESKAINGGKQLRNLWTFPCTPRSERSAGAHPSQKPAALLTRIVKLWTRPDDLILDCFLGTGTTAVAAKVLGRRWIGIEKDSAYGDIAARRIADAIE